MSPPNVLYIHSHDTGRYIQPYGHAVPTPHLQRLAEEGMLFRQCFCAGPTCSPSRAGLLAGQSPHSAGILGLAHRGFVLTHTERHLANMLKGAGYHTALIGFQHLVSGKDRPRIGYVDIPEVANCSVEAVAPAAEAWLKGRPAEPFFLSVGFSETHRDWDDLSAAADPRYVRPPVPIIDTPETRRDMAGFVEKAKIFDAGVGRVLDALDAAGLAENTLVIATTDHGIAFPLMKCNLTDHGTGVMLIVRGPGGFAGGKVCDALVSQIDLYPTLCDLLELAPPDWLEGTSMVPLVRGEVAEVREEVFSEVTYHAAYEPMRAVRTRRWKYIRRFDGRSRPVLPNCDGSPTKELFLTHGWAERPPAEEMLFDLVFDANEANNLASDEEHAEVLDEMRGRLGDWMKRTDDPLLKGHVPAPKGVRVNDADGREPTQPCIVVE
jgi:arylsulfatase A-like enzyme